MTFKYFEDPERFIGLQDTETLCDICKRYQIGFDAEYFYGSNGLTSICSECLARGKLIDYDCYTFDGDIKGLVKQVKQLNSCLTEN